MPGAQELLPRDFKGKLLWASLAVAQPHEVQAHVNFLQPTRDSCLIEMQPSRDLLLCKVFPIQPIDTAVCLIKRTHQSAAIGLLADVALDVARLPVLRTVAPKVDLFPILVPKPRDVRRPPLVVRAPLAVVLLVVQLAQPRPLLFGNRNADMVLSADEKRRRIVLLTAGIGVKIVDLPLARIALFMIELVCRDIHAAMIPQNI